MHQHVTATWISVETQGCEAGYFRLRDVKKATFIQNRRRPGLNNPDYWSGTIAVRFHLHKGRTLSLRKWLKPIVVAICVSTHSTKEPLPSSLQIEAFWVLTFYTRDFHLVLSPWTLSIFYVVARMWPLHYHKLVIKKTLEIIRPSSFIRIRIRINRDLLYCVNPRKSNDLAHKHWNFNKGYRR